MVEVRLAGRIPCTLRGRIGVTSRTGFILLPLGRSAAPKALRFEQIESIREIHRFPVINPVAAILWMALFAGCLSVLLWLAFSAS